MKSITDETLLTTKEVARRLNTLPHIITENAKKCLPNKVFQRGKTAYWTEAEITVLIDFLKRNSNRTDTAFTKSIKSGAISTSMTPALKIKQAMLLMQEGYEEELENLRAKNLEVVEENGQLKIVNKELLKSNQELIEFKESVENKIANNELVEVPSENVRNHLWQNMQKIGKILNNYPKAWHNLYELIKRDLSIDVKTRAINQNVKPIDVIANLDMETFNKIYAMSEKMLKEAESM